MKINNRAKIIVPVAGLQQHPAWMYTPSNVTELKNLIFLMGLLQPIIVNRQNQVLVGWRRLQAILLLGWTEVEVEIEDIPQDEQPAYIVNSNSQRQKTTVDCYNEMKVLKIDWARRQGTRTDLIQGLSEEEKLTTRARIANTINVSETTLHRIEFVGDKDVELLKLVDCGIYDSINEAYESLKHDKPLHETEVEEVSLDEVKCPTCNCSTQRIINDESNNLKFKTE